MNCKHAIPKHCYKHCAKIVFGECEYVTFHFPERYTALVVGLDEDLCCYTSRVPCHTDMTPIP